MSPYTLRSRWSLQLFWPIWMLLGIAYLSVISSSQAMSLSATSMLATPAYVGGSTGKNDARDADISPAVAYDSSTDRYLTVWTTLRNATSQSDGLDVYGRFLDSSGKPINQEFRISDSNSAARGMAPVVVSGNGAFVVAWTSRGTTCRVLAQRVTDQTAGADQVIASGVTHMHSPDIVYNSDLQRYIFAYVNGDDYLTSTLFGNTAQDCGSNASSTSTIQAVDVDFSNTVAIPGVPSSISAPRKGAFRPQLSYASTLKQYLVAWEDRDSVGGADYRFDVYAQRLDPNLAQVDTSIALATGGDYTNFDTTATWTPRPDVASNGSQFQVVWFRRDAGTGGVSWSVQQRLVNTSIVENPVTILATTYAGSYTGHVPSGFLTTAYSTVMDEFVVGASLYLDSIFGYYSTALVQRVKPNGQLLKLDGSTQFSAGVGWSVDAYNDDQIGISLALTSARSNGGLDYTFVYGKHMLNTAFQDFDIWTTQLQFSQVVGTMVPPTDTPTATPVTTSTLTPTGTPTATPVTTSTLTPTGTLTATPVITSTLTPTGTLTATPVITSTSTPTGTTILPTSTLPPTSTTVPPTVTPTAIPANVDVHIGQTYELAGKELSLTITTGNSGPDDLVGAIVDDPLPEPAPGTTWTWTCTATNGADCGTSLASTASQVQRGATLTQVTGTGNIKQQLGHLPVGGSVVFTVTGTLNNVQRWSNTPVLIIPSGTVNKNGSLPSAPSVGQFQVMLPLVRR